MKKLLLAVGAVSCLLIAQEAAQEKVDELFPCGGFGDSVKPCKDSIVCCWSCRLSGACVWPCRSCSAPHRRPSRGLPSWPCSDRKSTRLNSSHLGISYAVFCLKKK